MGTGTVLGGVRTWAQIFASVKTDSKEKVNKQSIKVQTAAKISKYIKIPAAIVYFERSNFTGLALGYIEADFCKEILIHRSFRDLQVLHTSAPLEPQYCTKVSSKDFISYTSKVYNAS